MNRREFLSAATVAGMAGAAQAVKLYDEVRGADLPQTRILEATRGAILARGAEGVPLHDAEGQAHNGVYVKDSRHGRREAAAGYHLCL